MPQPEDLESTGKQDSEKKAAFRLMNVTVFSDWIQSDLVITDLNVKLRFGSCRLIIKALHRDGSKLIAFISSDTLLAAYAAATRKLQKGSMSWRADRPWSEKVDKKAD